jgi:hypothetical protein
MLNTSSLLSLINCLQNRVGTARRALTRIALALSRRRGDGRHRKRSRKSNRTKHDEPSSRVAIAPAYVTDASGPTRRGNSRAGVSDIV